jgi:hypothetical protein
MSSSPETTGKAKCIREWVLLASTIISLLAGLGLNLVFSNSSAPMETQKLQMQMSDRIKENTEIMIRLDKANDERTLMLVEQAKMEQRLQNLDGQQRR